MSRLEPLVTRSAARSSTPWAFTSLGLRLRRRSAAVRCGHVEVRVGLGPLEMEVASMPVEEIEEKDTEGVVRCKGSFSLAYGTLTLLRDTKMHLKRTGSAVCWGRTGAVRRH